MVFNAYTCGDRDYLTCISVYKAMQLSMVSHKVWHKIVSPGLRSLLWSMVGKIVNIGLMGTVAISPLHDPVTWYKITHAGEQVTQWDFQNKGRSQWTGTSCIVLEVPLCNLLTSMCDFVPCDQIMQRANTKHNLKPTFKPCGYVWFPPPPWGKHWQVHHTIWDQSKAVIFFTLFVTWPKIDTLLKSDSYITD